MVVISTARTLMIRAAIKDRTLTILRKLQAEEFPCVGVSKEGAMAQINDRLLGEILFEKGRQAGLAQIIEILETEMDEILKQMEAVYEKEKREESQLP
jgi:hypothetical protein